MIRGKLEGLQWLVPLIPEQPKVVLVFELVSKEVALAQVPLIGKA